MPEYDDKYTFEYKGYKGWEVARVYNRETSLLKVTQDFLHTVLNDNEDLQWRLTTPTYQ